ncbi:50S ribosomal protein L11 methyltransferase [Xanthocytophaga agilis]|uniref:Ribosomal protein L11 methyltransferase n=1 Tax=Xanthocytophaga agilis TaxID=3048010 RepID=A0AAE3R316_9BACT|nr:50S ribosomal protein L11 methyltransferase [Xanthocytophaga agilis]MDJ1502235.1 50S ribosomal protein L11 methyltransferase [Xanthocytophaga agilis]
MDFIELKVFVSPEWAEIIIAELAEIGYESFVEFDEGIIAYVQKLQFNEELWQSVVEKYTDFVTIDYTIAEMQRKNWNEEWEKNYQPIVIDDQCIVKASFHQIEEKYPYEITINPQMSFGTGHHETTTLILQSQLQLEHEGLKVMDAGSGTGILAIMAQKRGAVLIDAFDIDEWAVTNAVENCQLNQSDKVRVQQGTISTVQLEDVYDIILANINRNILLDEMPLYASKLTTNGTLLLSGFYEQDIPELEKRASEFQLIKKQQTSKHQWASLWFEKR